MVLCGKSMRELILVCGRRNSLSAIIDYRSLPNHEFCPATVTVWNLPPTRINAPELRLSLSKWCLLNAAKCLPRFLSLFESHRMDFVIVYSLLDEFDCERKTRDLRRRTTRPASIASR
jgi:hypothetical protein